MSVVTILPEIQYSPGLLAKKPSLELNSITKSTAALLPAGIETGSVFRLTLKRSSHLLNTSPSELNLSSTTHGWE